MILSEKLVEIVIGMKSSKLAPFSIFMDILVYYILQIALAVGDANEIHQNATIRKLELQVSISRLVFMLLSIFESRNLAC